MLLMPSASPGRIDARSWLGLAFDQRVVSQFAMRGDADAPMSDVTRSAIDASDARDALQTRGGDSLAFERIVRRHQQDIARRLRCLSRDPLVLEELVQETFAQAFFLQSAPLSRGCAADPLAAPYRGAVWIPLLESAAFPSDPCRDRGTDGGCACAASE
ncbi:MAG: hypothetical protein SGJ11_03060 [Phycisphaerae bacterium]|nr:hypothetical protein [Phycisphaerae bacterium]